ncbi:lysylphosphatidylglycerol synthase transmembrane domain-containing protein [Bartonella machadoae]|uniref:lysylphosphatidylglycerol synthase transmembrane domain-containing protein n=1 Tax=Bartonella machadoae TaxID=2893471 RepID=UPI001F4C7418|nr:YbhN family protein [Bartonella machadoae]UNE55130.1 lysylphosphatidylglycerol synthase domain-containing protein [Bartonella machadoae]
MKLKRFIWPSIGILAMLISIRILYVKLSTISFGDVLERLSNLNTQDWLLASLCSLLAYTALAGYDRIALQHLGHKISWLFIALCSFTTYALSHNIGASVFSGAVVRYRAYKIKGLNGTEIAILVGFCSFTFVIGTILLFGIVLILQPEIIKLIHNEFPEWLGTTVGAILLGSIALYTFGSWLQLSPLHLSKKIQLSYPQFKIVIQQLLISPLELLAAAGIIYAVLPHNTDIHFISVLGVFLASFTITLLSNAPAGGIGVLEALFITGMPNVNPTDVVAALIVFRMLYLIIPLIISLFIVAIFEAQQYCKQATKMPPK